MIVNINYRGHIHGTVEHLKFSKWKPQQCVIRLEKYSLIIFKNCKCRIMGCKQPIDKWKIDIAEYKIKLIVERIQSITVTCKLGLTSVNMYKLAVKMDSLYEPELFPAIRINMYRPLCVNVFGNGNIVILGLKSLETINETVNDIVSNILKYAIV